MKHLAFAQSCRVCRKSRPLSHFTRPGLTKINKTCLECLDAKKAGKEPAPSESLSVYLPVVLTPEQRRVRRWWPEWVHAEEPQARLNPRGTSDVRVCFHCGEDYTSRSPAQKFCSKRCKSAWHRPAAREARENVLDAQAKA